MAAKFRSYPKANQTVLPNSECRITQGFNLLGGGVLYHTMLLWKTANAPKMI